MLTGDLRASAVLIFSYASIFSLNLNLATDDDDDDDDDDGGGGGGGLQELQARKLILQKQDRCKFSFPLCPSGCDTGSRTRRLGFVFYTLYTLSLKNTNSALT